MSRSALLVVALSFSAALELACGPAHARPPAPPPPMHTQRFAYDVRTDELHDMERARAFVTPPSLRFELVGSPEITPHRIRVRGRLVNPDAVAHEVIVYPAGPGGFYVGFAPNRGIVRRPPPSGTPPMPPPAPVPPMRFEIPARTAITFESTLDPGEYTYTPGADVVLEWSYLLWNEPRPSGELHVVIP